MARIIFQDTFHIKQIETIAEQIISNSQQIKCWCFYGDLGAGKTTLISTMIPQIISIDKREISSPTYVYLHEYESVCHFDLYRIMSAREFEAMGFTEYFNRPCFIEWAERIELLLPEKRVELMLQILDEQTRKIQMRIHESKTNPVY